MSKEQGWREVRGRVSADRLAEAERVKAMLPPGYRVTVDDLGRPAPERPQRPPAPKRRAGRPRGRTHSREVLIATYRTLHDALKRRPTQQELVDNLEPRIGVTTLVEHLRDYGLPWPIE